MDFEHISVNWISGDASSQQQLVSETECLYSASQSLRNSVDLLTPNGCCKSQFLNLRTLKFVSQDFIPVDARISERYFSDGKPIFYLEIRREKKWKHNSEVEEEARKLAETSALIAAGSANVNGLTSGVLYTEILTYHILSHPEGRIVDLPQNQNDWFQLLPPGLAKQLRDIVACIRSIKHIEIESALFDAEGAQRVVDDIRMDPNSAKVLVAPQEWQCQFCGKKKNLWLNLSDGYIGCGRRQYGVEDSGCLGAREGAAIQHYSAHPDYHVCVKLGTLSSVNVEAYSYKFDDFVIVRNVDHYLENIGVSRENLQQTESSIKDLAVEKNQSLQFGIPSSEDELETRVTDTGLVGIVNIGNTCYMGSVLQLMANIFSSCETKWNLNRTDVSSDALLRLWLNDHLQLHPQNLPRDFEFQLLRLLSPLVMPIDPRSTEWLKSYKDKHTQLSSELGEDLMKNFSPTDPNFEPGTPSPYFFKRIVGRKNREFLTNFQQDAEEFYQCLISLLEAHEHPPPPAKTTQQLLCFTAEEKRKLTNGKIQITHRSMPLLICNMGSFLTGDVSLEELLGTWQHPFPNVKNGISKWSDWLLIQARRLTEDETYAAIKINTAVHVPLELHLEHLKAEGISPGEEQAMSSVQGIESLEPHKAANLRDFGFSDSQISACVAVLGINKSVEELTEWMIDHPDKRAPALHASQNVELVMELGFDIISAKKALEICNDDVAQAVNWLMEGHMAELTESEATTDETTGAEDSRNTSYDLRGVIVHLGSSARSGHYVAYLQKNQRWYLFNDSVVSACKGIPDFRMGYLFLYQRRQ
eukprot:Gregarina_sp_Poly_1__3788@NODE_2125_length_2634_cov_101_701208_g1368_i0_p1_GENE_NODE_2125_length_2634_cov_101_701208_g1368_i0NODE_2125_length_2634_cov_101_701208_g1368_i0_p1_ORF_typecomplete_len813_score132_17UCH/PF00443_29/2_6e13UCH/PF00443_29/2_2e19zfUBP/PF02148_19/1_5e10UCH_1/PF13423_6/12UCH_1/PF13423_6/2_3e08UBA/PF00627_31/1_3e04UBA/PF00627_31/6_7e02UBA/PF00627_31/0_0001DUF3203/PF11462_8/0_47_NODE_2125_length_2634_cov_101_701208_g1368_i0532491